MKALRWHGRGDVRLEDVPDASPPGEGEVTVDVTWCGICGTDLEEFRDGPLVIPVEEPNPLSGQTAPIVMGHEVAGRISRVGKEVRGLREGDLVGVDGLIYCGECYWCRRHRPNLCPKLASIGLMADGGLAERLTIHASSCIPFADGIRDDDAALAEPVSVAVRAVRRGRLRLGERMAVLGAGAIGLGVVQVGAVSGASQIDVVDPISFRRELALKLGATRVLEPGEGLAERLEDADGVGPDLVVDATGQPNGPEAALMSARRGGRAVAVGLPPEPSEVDVIQMILREVELIASMSHVYDEDFRAAVELISDGRVDASPLVTARIPIERVVEDGFGALVGPEREKTLKVLVSPDGWIA